MAANTRASAEEKSKAREEVERLQGELAVDTGIAKMRKNLLAAQVKAAEAAQAAAEKLAEAAKAPDDEAKQQAAAAAVELAKQANEAYEGLVRLMQEARPDARFEVCI